MEIGNELSGKLEHLKTHLQEIMLHWSCRHYGLLDTYHLDLGESSFLIAFMRPSAVCYEEAIYSPELLLEGQ